VDNTWIRDLRNVPRFFVDATTFSALPSNQSYRPLVSTVLAIEYALAGSLDPFWFQLLGFAFFVGVVLAIGFIIYNLLNSMEPHFMNVPLSIAAAGLYGLHPANADTVNYIIAQADILSTLAVLLSVVSVISFPGTRRAGIFSLPAAIGVLVKPPAAMFAPLYAVYALLFERAEPGEKHFAQRRWARIALAFFLCGLAIALVSHMTPKQWEAGASNKAAYLLTQPYVAMLYMKTFLWPSGLSADYDLDAFSTLADSRFWAGIVFTGALIAGTVYCMVKRRLRVIGYGLAWFILALLPTSLLPLAEVMNDHRAFFPYAGLVMALAGVCQLVVTGEPRWSARRIAVATCTVTAIYLAMTLGTYRRNEIWRSEETLWYDVTIKSPGNGRGLMNYGTTQMAKGDFKRALEYFNRAKALYPYYHTLFINIAIAEGATGHPVEAERDFRDALSMSPSSPDSYIFYGRWLVENGRKSEAIPLLQKALALSPADATAQGFLRKASGSESAADSSSYYLNQSAQAYKNGDFQQAIRMGEEAIRLQPDNAEAWNNIGAAYNAMGQYTTAAAALKEAIRQKPGMTLARNNLAYAEEKLKEALSK
jgi:Flp pilus assembly protein TadD